MIDRARAAMLYAIGGAAVLVSIYAAATFALERDGMLSIDAATASRLSVDYSQDEHSPVLSPLDPSIIGEIVSDEEQLPPLPGAPQPALSGGAPLSLPTPRMTTPSATPRSDPSPNGQGTDETPDARPTSTPRIDATATPRPEPTNTPRSEPTNTQAPKPTDTPGAKPTETQEPKKTDTPTPTRTPRRCPIIDLPPALDELYQNCRTHTPSPTKSPTKTPTPTKTAAPTRTPINLPDVDDILCSKNPVFC